MVKVQKPSPKSIKKDILVKTKKTQIKKSKDSFSKDNIKKIAKQIETLAKPKVKKIVGQKNGDLNKSPIVPEKVKNTILKKKQIVPKVQAKVKTDAEKKKSIGAEAAKKPKRAVDTKKTIGAVTEKKLNKAVNTKKSKKVKKIVQNKTPLAAKVASKTQKAGDKNKIIQKKKLKQKAQVEETNNIQALIFEPTYFDEKKFKDILSLENIKKIVKALKILVEKEVSEKKTSIYTDYKYILNVSSYKIPNCPKRMVKLNLEHSLVDAKRDDIAMIVADLQRGAKFDYEPTIQHYEDIFREIGLDNIKIIPFNQLRNEYTSFEAKRKLANTYDFFLCDGRIVGHVVGFCGKHFQKPRTTFHAVRFNNPKTYKKEIEHALKRTSFRQLQKGDMISIPVGSHIFNADQVAENIDVVIKQLKTLFPGGYENIRNIYVKIDIKGTSSLPLYVSLAGAPAEDPNVIGPREHRMLKLKKQANDILSKFSMTKAGDFVKLSKTQVERKHQIREARTALLSKENEDESINDEPNPALRKKVKKTKSQNDRENKIKAPPKKKVKKNIKYESPINTDDSEGEDGSVQSNEE